MIFSYVPPQYYIFLRFVWKENVPAIPIGLTRRRILKRLVSDDSLNCIKFLVTRCHWSLTRGYTCLAIEKHCDPDLIRYCFERDYSIHSHSLENIAVESDCSYAFETLPLYPWNLLEILKACLDFNSAWAFDYVLKRVNDNNKVEEMLWSIDGYQWTFPYHIIRWTLHHGFKPPSNLAHTIVQFVLGNMNGNTAEPEWHPTFNAMIYGWDVRFSVAACESLRNNSYRRWVHQKHCYCPR